MRDIQSSFEQQNTTIDVKKTFRETSSTHFKNEVLSVLGNDDTTYTYRKQKLTLQDLQLMKKTLVGKCQEIVKNNDIPQNPKTPQLANIAVFMKLK